MDGGLGKGAAGREHIADRALDLHHDVVAAIDRRAVDQLGPTGAAVVGAEHAGASAGIQALRRAAADDDVEDVAEIAGHTGGRHRRGQRRPGRAAVGGLEHAGATDGVAVEHAFAGAGVQHLRVLRVHRQADHGDVGQQQVGQLVPVGAAIGGLPDAAADGGRVHDVGVGRVDHQLAGASALVGRAERVPGTQQITGRGRQSRLCRQDAAPVADRMKRRRLAPGPGRPGTAAGPASREPLVISGRGSGSGRCAC